MGPRESIDAYILYDPEEGLTLRPPNREYIDMFAVAVVQASLRDATERAVNTHEKRNHSDMVSTIGSARHDRVSVEQSEAGATVQDVRRDMMAAAEVRFDWSSVVQIWHRASQR